MGLTGANSLLGLLVLFNIAGVMLGYRGIAKLQLANFPPFFVGDSLFTMLGCAWPPVPDFIILGWNAILGRIVIWAGCFSSIAYAYHLFARKQRQAPALFFLSGATLLFGGVGLWIYLHSAINAM